MIEHSNLIVTAWDGQLLIGIEAFDEDRGQQRALALFAWDRKVPDHAVDYGVPRTGLPEDEQQTRRIKTVRRRRTSLGAAGRAGCITRGISPYL
jgi:hypothetical protein